MHDDQFTAMGPPFAESGFEKTALSTVPTDVGFEFGVRVLARRCGVMGQTDGDGVAGVYGHGRFSRTGVLGTGFAHRTGVIGASITSSEELLNLNRPPGQVDLRSLGAGSGTGVLGTSGSGFGIHGTSESNTAVVGTSDTGFGVHGISHGANDGVRGTSADGIGGVFESARAAQLRLVPGNAPTPEGRIGGAGGELLVTTTTDATGTPVFCLWLCTRPGDAATATWDLVAGRRPFPGTTLTPGATGTDIKRVQMQLNLTTGTDLVNDGELGPITTQAVTDFQERHTITPTGSVDRTTWDTLFALSPS